MAPKYYTSKQRKYSLNPEKVVDFFRALTKGLFVGKKSWRNTVLIVNKMFAENGLLVVETLPRDYRQFTWEQGEMEYFFGKTWQVNYLQRGRDENMQPSEVTLATIIMNSGGSELQMFTAKHPRSPVDPNVFYSAGSSRTFALGKKRIKKS